MSGPFRYYAWLLRNWLRGDYEGGRISYGQFGEDILIHEALRSGQKELSPRDIRYLDIGANHPTRLSNTMYFYTRGAHGVLIEPNPVLAELLRRRRPRDTVLDIGVAASGPTALDFYLMNPDVLSTFSHQTALRYQDLGYELKETRKIRVLSIAQVIHAHFPQASPHIFSLDVEGHDEEILLAIDWSLFKPHVICAETWDMCERKERVNVIDLINAKGYHVFAKVGPNTVFLRRTN